MYYIQVKLIEDIDDQTLETILDNYINQDNEQKAINEFFASCISAHEDMSITLVDPRQICFEKTEEKCCYKILATKPMFD